MDEPITKIINDQLVKPGQFTQEECDIVLRKIKNRKVAGIDEIPSEVLKTRKFADILLWYCNAVYNQNTIHRWTKDCILPLPMKGDRKMTKNYWGITLTLPQRPWFTMLCYSTALKLKLRKFLGRTKMASREINPWHHKFWQSIEF